MSSHQTFPYSQSGIGIFKDEKMLKLIEILKKIADDCFGKLYQVVKMNLKDPYDQLEARKLFSIGLHCIEQWDNVIKQEEANSATAKFPHLPKLYQVCVLLYIRHVFFDAEELEEPHLTVDMMPLSEFIYRYINALSKNPCLKDMIYFQLYDEHKHNLFVSCLRSVMVSITEENVKINWDKDTPKQTFHLDLMSPKQKQSMEIAIPLGLTEDTLHQIDEANETKSKTPSVSSKSSKATKASRTSNASKTSKASNRIQEEKDDKENKYCENREDSDREEEEEETDTESVASDSSSSSSCSSTSTSSSTSSSSSRSSTSSSSSSSSTSSSCSSCSRSSTSSVSSSSSSCGKRSELEVSVVRQQDEEKPESTNLNSEQFYDSDSESDLEEYVTQSVYSEKDQIKTVEL